MTCGIPLLFSLLVPHAESGSPGDRPLQANAAAIVKYLNENAGRMQSVTFTAVSMKVSQDGNTGSVDGRLDCQRPRNFRLSGKTVGQPMVDLGSNSEEFWYWISKADPPYVYHCSYADLARSDVSIPSLFQPDMILAVLGLLEYDASKSYDVRIRNDTVELIESTKLPQGQPAKKITVFRSGPVGRDEPIVIGHILRDAQGKDICRAAVTNAQTDPATGAVLPRRVQLSWPSERIEVTVKLDGLRVNAIDHELAATLFSRKNLSSLRSCNLARRQLREAQGAPIEGLSGAVLENVISKATHGSKTAGTIIGAGVGTIAGVVTAAVRDANDRHDLVSELIAILNETKSVSTFYVTLGVLAELGPRAEPAIPAIIRNAERLDCGADATEALERTIKAILRKKSSTKTRHRTPSTSGIGEKKQTRRKASVEEMALLAGQVKDEFDHPAANATVLVVAAREGGGPAPAPFRVEADERGNFFIPGLDRGKQYRLTAQVKEGKRIAAEGGVDAQAPDPCIIIRVSAVAVPCVPVPVR